MWWWSAGGAILLLGSVLAVAGPATAAIFEFDGNLAGFNALAGNPPISISFDDLATGTNLAGQTITGVTFSSPDGNTLEVVAGSVTATALGFTGVIDASTNKLFPTSGTNVLSPGGTDLVAGPALGQKDSLQLDFATPLAAFGLDILYQSLDFAAFTSWQIFDPSLTLIASGSVDTSEGGGGGSPGGAHFIGFVSDNSATNIRRIIFSDNDDNAEFPDANIGYDSLRFFSLQEPPRVPLPGSLLLVGSGLIAVAAAVRRRRPHR